MRNYNDTANDPHDESRTTRSHAGEAIEDNRNWPGYFLIAVGLAALGITLTAAGYGYGGWALIGAGTCVACFAVGSAIVILEHRRIKAREGKELGTPEGH